MKRFMLFALSAATLVVLAAPPDAQACHRRSCGDSRQPSKPSDLNAHELSEGFPRVEIGSAGFWKLGGHLGETCHDYGQTRRRDKVRRSLSELTVSLKYKDIYDRRMPDAVRDLQWFKRNLAGN